ncbi:MAG: tetratricopeptide repeat protein [Gemmatimonadetes bacterium]|nr:tetratricopeptide repeat protein [Gemmatimonadota bacterium]
MWRRRTLLTLMALIGARSLPGQRWLRDSTAALEARVAEDSTDAGTSYRLAIFYYLAKRYDDEQRLLRRVTALDPRYAPAYLALADSAYERRPKLYEEVRRNRVPREWQAAVERSQRMQRQAYLIDPLADFRVRGTEAPPEGVVTIGIDRDMLNAASDAGKVLTDYLLYLGLTMFYATRYELSYEAFRKYVERAYGTKPHDSIPDFVLWFRGLAAGHRGIYNVAIEDFQTLLDRSLKEERKDSLIPYPLRTNDYRYTLAVLHQAARRPADALRLYQESIANDLGLYMAHVRLAEMYRQFKMWPQAIEEQQRAIATNPDDPTAQYELGVILAETGKPAEAEEQLRQAMARNPLDPRIPYRLGLVAQQLNKPSEARAAFERFIALGATRYDRQLADAKQRLATLQ